MSAATQEIIQIYNALPPEKRLEVVNFARFLLAQQAEESWERFLTDPEPRPRLSEFLSASATEGDEPLDPKRL